MRRLILIVSIIASLAVASTVVLFVQVRRAARQGLLSRALDRAGAFAIAARAAPADDGVLDKIASALTDSTVIYACVYDSLGAHRCEATADAPDAQSAPAMIERVLKSGRHAEHVRDGPVGRLGQLELWYPLKVPRVETFAPGPETGDQRVLLLVVDPESANQVIRQTLMHAGLLIALLGVLIVLTVSQSRSLGRERALERRLADERRFTELGRLSAVLAHEVRNPLGAIKGFAQLTAHRFTDDDPARGDLETIIAESTRLERLVHSLLLYARPLELRREHVDVCGLVERVVRQVRMQRTQRVDARDVALDVDVPASAVLASIDAELVTQALLNLVANAVEAVEDAGRVHIALTEDEHAVRIAVTDTGAGIPADVVEEIFDPYVTRKATGTGLGLAVTRRIALLHGGTIVVDKTDSTGTRMVLTLPK